MIDPKILHRELKFRTSRSSGSGGQHINKVETRVELLFDVEGSVLLTEEQKRMITERLGNRINKEGVLFIGRQDSRSQQRNKEAAVLQFNELITQALRPVRRRKKAKPSAASMEVRLRRKKQQAEKKALRRKVDY